ncbi:MAG: hypothetical protein JWM47_242 [Acidimicrobiales bacterium]|nr:hypothetical protein [Acidimicrobiales bacterium]
MLVLAMGIAGCSGDGGSDAGSTKATAPEDVRTSDAKVAAGLAKINATAVEIAAAAALDKGEAVKLTEDIEPSWQPIEGTIKANDADTYLAFEDAFAVIEKAAEDGDAGAASGAVTDIAAASASYLKAYPG